jgi:hypothetical protein
MIESKDEFNDLLNRLKAKDKENKLGKSLQTKLQAFLEVEKLINLPISGVVRSKRFNKNDLLRAYQAGAIENQDDCVSFGYDDLKELLDDANKWYKRYTE